MKSKPIGKICLGCGSSMTDEQLALKKMYDNKLISCCPDRKMVDVYTAPRELSDVEILEAIEQFREWTNPPYKAYEDTYMDGWLDACNEIYSAVFEILKKTS